MTQLSDETIKKLDEILANLMDYSYEYGKGAIPSSENPPLIIARQAKQAIIKLIDEHYVPVESMTDASVYTPAQLEEIKREVESQVRANCYYEAADAVANIPGAKEYSYWWKKRESELSKEKSNA